jgi:hypothetical protein
MLLGRFRSKASLEAEILALRHQLNVLRRTSPRRAVLSNFDRMIFVCLYRIAPRILDARRKMSRCCRSTAFSALSRAFDLDGQTRMARTNQRSPITRSAYAIRAQPPIG